jgi:hypothetical protein
MRRNFTGVSFYKMAFIVMPLLNMFLLFSGFVNERGSAVVRWDENSGRSWNGGSKRKIIITIR